MTETIAQQVHVDAPWKIPPRAWWEILKRVYAAMSANHLGLLSAGVAYYAFLSIAPLLAAVVLTYGLVGDPQIVARHMQAIITVVPADAMAAPRSPPSPASSATVSPALALDCVPRV